MTELTTNQLNKLMIDLDYQSQRDWVDLSQQNQLISRRYETSRKIYVGGINNDLTLPDDQSLPFYFKSSLRSRTMFSANELRRAAMLTTIPAEVIDTLIETLQTVVCPPSISHFIHYR